MTTSAARILLVEDDDQLSAMIAEFLRQHHFQVGVEARGDVATRRILDENPDLVILDVNLPGRDGFGVCRAVREHYAGPIVILTARGDEVDEIVGLELGADDYIAKPVRPRLLLARVRAHLRKVSPASGADSHRELTVGDLTINSGRRTVEIGGESVELTTAEFDLLWLLAQSAGSVVSRDDIYRNLLGVGYDGVDRSIDLRVSRLRKKLNDDPAHPARVKSVRGVGYILVSEK